MGRTVSRPLAQAIRLAVTGPDAAPRERHRIGVVTSVSPLEVYLPGMTSPDPGLPASRVASYTSPAAGDRVLILQDDTDLAILGKLISGG